MRAASARSSAFRQCRSACGHADNQHASFGTFTRLSTGHTSGFIVVRHALGFALPARSPWSAGRPAIRRVAIQNTLTGQGGAGNKMPMASMPRPAADRVLEGVALQGGPFLVLYVSPATERKAFFPAVPGPRPRHNILCWSWQNGTSYCVCLRPNGGVVAQPG